ncbi:MAG TPA: glycosyltransferase family 39 protein, partial [Gemmatimonadaceae bacterium]|nr:glycosyltransferase family 39 protein [Gemmatimonadaceae bacterium]
MANVAGDARTAAHSSYAPPPVGGARRSASAAPVWRLLALLLVIAPLCALYGIARRDVVDVNEAQRLQPAIEMLERGDYIVPTLDGERYLSKPPLIYWVAAGAFRIAGAPSALAGRVPVAIACLLIAAALGAIGWRTAGARVGLWSAIILLSSFYFRARARETELDPLLTGAVLGAVYGQWLAVVRARWLRPALLAGICAGLALLLKGPVLFLFLLASTLAIAVVERPALRRVLAPLGLILGVGAAIFLPWGVALLARVGAGELWATLQNESLTRLTTATRINSGPPWFYVESVAASFLPWSWLIPFWASPTLRRDLRASASSWLRVTGLFAAAALVLFSLVAGKETEYLMPIYPFLALLAAAALDWLVRADAPLA